MNNLLTNRKNKKTENSFKRKRSFSIVHKSIEPAHKSLGPAHKTVSSNSDSKANLFPSYLFWSENKVKQN